MGTSAWRRWGYAGLVAWAIGGMSAAQAQAWDAVRHFRYDIENVMVWSAGPGAYKVRVVFAVADPTTGTRWNIKADAPFQPVPAATSATASLTLDVGWDPSHDFSNTGSENPGLNALISTTITGKGAAVVAQVRDLHKASSSACTSATCPGVDSANRFYVDKVVTPVPFGQLAVRYGRVALEGRPLCIGLAECAGTTLYAVVPVTSATADFAFQPADPNRAMVPDTRRKIVDMAKCARCHDGGQHGDVVVPKLSLHGGNRNENLGLCVMCHNANQTDVPYRQASADPLISGPETSVDFKTMVHSIHAGGFRERDFVVIGRSSSVNNFGDVRFPSQLRNCLNCHVESAGRGSYELPIDARALGTTTNTRSLYNVPPGGTRVIDVDPASDVKTSPTAAACSACHDKAEVRSHMVRRGGASFSAAQGDLGVTVRERCASCHGPGKDEDVKRAHEIGRSDSHDD